MFGRRTRLRDRQDRQDPVAVSTDFRGDFDIENGDVAIASITSCTNTSNPSVMIAAGLIARNAHAKGLSPSRGSRPRSPPARRSWPTTSRPRRSRTISTRSATSWSASAAPPASATPDAAAGISEAINANDLTVTAVLSGNRNFEGRISPDVKMNYLASPPLVIAYALAGTMDFDFETQPLGTDADGNDVYLKDIWPTNEEVAVVVDGTVSREMFLKDYASVFDGDHRWKASTCPKASCSHGTSIRRTCASRPSSTA